MKKQGEGHFLEQQLQQYQNKCEIMFTKLFDFKKTTNAVIKKTNNPTPTCCMELKAASPLGYHGGLDRISLLMVVSRWLQELLRKIWKVAQKEKNGVNKLGDLFFQFKSRQIASAQFQDLIFSSRVQLSCGLHRGHKSASR